MLGAGTEHIVNSLTQPKRPSQLRIRTADGSVHTPTGVINIPYTVNGETKFVETQVIPTIATQLILGTDFWEAFGIRPMFCCAIEENSNNEDEDRPPKFEPVNVKHKLADEQQHQLNEIVKLFPTAPTNGILGCTDRTVHKIDTGDTPPIRQRQYVVSPYIQKGINEEIDRMLEKDIITPVSNPTWLNPIVAVKKKNGKIRICIDARRLNQATIKNAYPQANADRILRQLRGTRYLTAIDLSDAFYQIRLDPESQRKTAFAVSGRGAFMYKRMPMGLCNASATISELVQNVFGCELEPYAFHFIDDFIVATDSFEEHLAVLRKVAENLQRVGLQISAEKSRFCMSKLVFLGYVIDGNGTQADPEKVQPIVEYPQPKNVRDVRRVLGMANWYRRFIKNFSSISAPISNLIRKSKEKFEWNEEAQAAFGQLKLALVSAPILALPNFDLPFQIECDASDLGIGAVLTQVQNGEERVIAYMSAKLNSAQRKYFATEKECLAVLTAIEKFRQYIEGAKFTVISDHASLQWLQNLRDPAGRLARWALRLQAYDYEIRHRKGHQMVVPDALSRAVEMLQAHQLTNTADGEYIALRAAIENSPDDHTDLRVDGNLILKNVGKKSDTIDDAWRLYVPTDFRRAALLECHDEPLASHGGFMKTMYRLRRLYYWPKMQQEVMQYVRECDICRATKPTNMCQRFPMGKYRDPERPFKIIAIDYIGPLVRSKHQHKHLLVVVDTFSKFVLLKPLRSATADATIEFLKNEVFLKFGVPAILISDNGSQLKSSMFAEFLNKYGVKHWRTASYHPQANATEAANKSIVNAIRAYIKNRSSQRDWDSHLAEINCALNTAKHSQTSFAPYTVLFGYNMCTCGNEHLPVDDHSSQRNKSLEQIRLQVSENLRAAYERNKKKYDLRTREVTYQPNDTVWKANTQLSNAANFYSSKLDDRYIKAKIIERTGTSTYRLSDMNGKDIGVFSTKDLKPA